MNDFTILIQKYPNYLPFLESIETNKISFKKNNHALLFSFLIGYFSNRNMNLSDLNNIFNKYQNENFNQKNFFADFKIIAYIFFDYFDKKEVNNSQINNINNFNVINVNINNSDFNLVKENNNIINNQNNEKPNNQINLNYPNINELGLKKQSSNEINLDYEYAKMLEEQENMDLAKIIKEDEKAQTKKCEICLEDFSLLDITNYYLNCNCILHNVCFDNMVKAAVESNSLPIKCPNCKIPIHPNFIEDSLRNANPQLFDKYEHFSMNNFLLNNNDEYSSCPTPGCEYMFFFNPGEFNFLCPLCNKNYCLNCKDDWHRGMTCQQYKDSRDVNKLDNQFFQFVKGAKFKMCPRCKYWVEKNQGCNHMKCRCGADFCYLCGDFMDMSRQHKCKK